jgi:hypothetical protein
LHLFSHPTTLATLLVDVSGGEPECVRCRARGPVMLLWFSGPRLRTVSAVGIEAVKYNLQQHDALLFPVGWVSAKLL